MGKSKRRKFVVLKTSKLKAFALMFTLLALVILTFQILIGDFSRFTILHFIGASGYILQALVSLIASRKHEHCVLVTFLVVSVLNILYSIVWIAGMQLNFSIAENDKFIELGKGPSHINQIMFILLLSAHYLMIGIGTALSIMAVAFATSALKEHSLQSTAEHLSR